MPVELGKSGFPIRWKVPSQKVQKTFRNAGEVVDFLQSEQQFWSALRKQLEAKQGITHDTAGYFDRPVNAIGTAYGSISSNSSASDANQVLTKMERAGSPFSDGVIGKMATQLSETAPHLVPGLIFLNAAREASEVPALTFDRRRPESMSVVSNALGAAVAMLEERLSGRADASVQLETTEAAQSLKTDLEVEKASFEQWSSEARATWSSDIEKYKADQQLALSSTEAQLQQAIADSQQRVDDLEKKISTDLAVQAPTAYWRGKATTHFRIAITFGALFVLVLGGGLGWLMASGADFIAEATRIVSNPDAPNTAVFLPIIFVSVPALAIGWVLRHISRVIVQNLALAADAQLRGTIATTYRALTVDRPPSEAETAIVLQALFRPMDGSGHSEIEPPSLSDIMRMTTKT